MYCIGLLGCDELEAVAALEDVVDGGEPAVDAGAEPAHAGGKAAAAELGVVDLQVLALEAQAPRPPFKRSPRPPPMSPPGRPALTVLGEGAGAGAAWG